MKVFKVFIKPSEAPQRTVKTNISVNFFFQSGIETGLSFETKTFQLA